VRLTSEARKFRPGAESDCFNNIGAKPPFTILEKPCERNWATILDGFVDPLRGDRHPDLWPSDKRSRTFIVADKPLRFIPNHEARKALRELLFVTPNPSAAIHQDAFVIFGALAIGCQTLIDIELRICRQEMALVVTVSWHPQISACDQRCGRRA
jgi:hypothetical protein